MDGRIRGSEPFRQQKLLARALAFALAKKSCPEQHVLAGVSRVQTHAMLSVFFGHMVLVQRQAQLGQGVQNLLIGRGDAQGLL